MKNAAGAFERRASSYNDKNNKIIGNDWLAPGPTDNYEKTGMEKTEVTLVTVRYFVFTGGYFRL